MRVQSHRQPARSKPRTTRKTVYRGMTPSRGGRPAVIGKEVTLLGQPFYKISQVDQMAPFFMTLVSDSNHWAFLSSSGGITAGRVHANDALFPYYTDDKVRDMVDQSGGKSLFRVVKGRREYLWEPFSHRTEGLYRVERHLYKSLAGNAIVFEEINHDLKLGFQSAWRNSDRYGWVRTVWLANRDRKACRVHLLDGLLHLQPWGLTVALQTTLSTLTNAYRRSELEEKTGLACFALSSVLTDSAEPSEALKATTVWQTGLPSARISLSSLALEAFRRGEPVVGECDVKGSPGNYLVSASVTLAPGGRREWSVVADVSRDHAAVVALRRELVRDGKELPRRLARDIEAGTRNLTALIAGVDGLQKTADPVIGPHHFANTLFNAMRGGVFASAYEVSRAELGAHVQVWNRDVYARHVRFFETLPEQTTVQALREKAEACGAPDLERLCGQYLPLSFSRRHGDPSRPWNMFTIRVKKEDGGPDLHYEGNWRDIFQNWEALGFSLPDYIEGFVRTFLSSTSADGYNPYRITNQGVDWERPEPHNPWANIGYWSDHQIIYLQKLLESLESFHPGRLTALLDRKTFSHVHVPYRLRRYEDLVRDARSTIDFDADLDRRISKRVKVLGADGRLLADAKGQVIHASLVEKSLILLLAKLSNLVPEGGIWMNTQRPEWNDANNALVGKGLSMVTVCYLRRFVAFLERLLSRDDRTGYSVAAELGTWLAGTTRVLKHAESGLERGFDDRVRRRLMDGLGRAGSDYRHALYDNGLSGRQASLSRRELVAFLTLARRVLEQTIRANRRKDALYHAYNILHLEPGRATIGRLDEMLEGQVAVLSSGQLTPSECLALLASLRRSALYRADQDSYMLYPRRLPTGFWARNQVDPKAVRRSPLLSRLLREGDRRLISQDVEGGVHFNGEFHNERDVVAVLAALRSEARYARLAAREEKSVLSLFERTFNHSSFTGRAGSFFAYEGIGSIYWHMVAKLLLAVQENHASACRSGASSAVCAKLARHYADIRGGLGFNKTPAEYGAFPADPYSHSPWGCGARQPGMTGQVKEELLTRLGELGVSVEDGCLSFRPRLLDGKEWFTTAQRFAYRPVNGNGNAECVIPRQGLAFTLCQVPIIYRRGTKAGLTIHFADGTTRRVAGDTCDRELSRELFGRTGKIRELGVEIA